jgi:ribose-phosphate pyrophosphokinase
MDSRILDGGKMKIISGPASMELGQRIGELSGAEVVPVFFKTFPDGESYFRFEVRSLEDEDIAIVQTTSPPQDQRLVQLLLLADNAKDMGARSITAVMPYFAYNRQDKRFLPGEAFSVRTIVKLLRDCGVSRIVSVNAHNPAVLRDLSVPIEDLSAVPLLAEYFREKLAGNPVSLSLGKKGLSVAQEADRVLSGGFDYIATKRDTQSGNVTLEDKKLPIKDREAIIFDDIISSGGTMTKAVKFVKDQGAERVYVACVHPLLTGDSQRKILENGAEEIVGTDCVQSQVSKVTVAPLISKALMRKGA